MKLKFHIDTPLYDFNEELCESSVVVTVILSVNAIGNVTSTDVSLPVCFFPNCRIRLLSADYYIVN